MTSCYVYVRDKLSTKIHVTKLRLKIDLPVRLLKNGSLISHLVDVYSLITNLSASIFGQNRHEIQY